MSYVRYHHTHERDRSPYHLDDDAFYRPLVRQNFKRARVDIYDDDGYDDYPYPDRTVSKPSKPSRALTIRQPNQIEKYNVWSYPSTYHHHKDSHSHDDHEHSHKKYYKYTRKTTSRPDDYESDPDYKIQVKASYRRPSSSGKAMAWSGDMFRRREKWDAVDWESKEREEKDGFWDDEPQLKERTVTYRRLKRTRTDEWKPLSGFRHI